MFSKKDAINNRKFVANGSENNSDILSGESQLYIFVKRLAKLSIPHDFIFGCQSKRNISVDAAVRDFKNLHRKENR